MMPRVFGDDGVGTRQAQASAALFGGEVRVEDAMEVLFGDSRSVVDDGDDDEIARRQLRRRVSRERCVVAFELRRCRRRASLAMRSARGCG